MLDRNPDVRHAAARAVGTEAPENQDDHPERGVEPMEADLPTLLRFLNAGGDNGRRAAAGLLQLCEKSDFEGTGLIAAERVPGPWRKKCATAEFELPEAAVRSPDVLIRRVAMEAAASTGARASSLLGALMDATESMDAWVRSNAIEALGNIGPAAAPAVPRLIGLLDGDQRSNAARSLGAIGAAAISAVPRLLDMVRNPEEHTGERVEALNSLLKIAPEEADVQKALHEAAEDKDDLLRAMAVERLR
jgi:HEAT repeat protein